MKIGELGEFGLIRRLAARMEYGRRVVKGIGDDCAVVNYTKERYQLLTQDMIVEGVDFTRADPAFLVGRKALAVSVSDIAACAGLPQYALVSLGLPPSTTVETVDELYRGMRRVAGEFGISIVGGDMSRAPKLTIDVSVVGTVEKRFLALRSGAKVGDAIFVSGKLGGSRYGRHLSFVPRVALARYLARTCAIHAMIDISDGLIQDTRHILREEALGAVIYAAKVPRNKDCRNLAEALTMGEDFELLFTVGRKDALRLAGRKKDVTCIGTVLPASEGLVIEDASGRRRKAAAGSGFTHF